MYSIVNRHYGSGCVSSKDARNTCFGRIMYGVRDKQTADQLTRTKQTADVPSSTEHN